MRRRAIDGKLREDVDEKQNKKFIFHQPRYPLSFDTKCVTLIGNLGEDSSQGHFLLRNMSLHPQLFRLQVNDFKQMFKIRPKMGVISALNDIEITVKFFGDALPMNRVFLNVVVVRAEEGKHWIDNLCSKTSYRLARRLKVDFLLWNDTEALREWRCTQLFERERDDLLDDVDEDLLERDSDVIETLYETGVEVEPTLMPEETKMVIVEKWAMQKEEEN